jgi:hypothetical protein
MLTKCAGCHNAFRPESDFWSDGNRYNNCALHRQAHVESNVFDSLEEFEELFHALVLNSLSEALEPDKSGTVGTVGALGLETSLQDSGVHMKAIPLLSRKCQNVDGYRY